MAKVETLTHLYYERLQAARTKLEAKRRANVYDEERRKLEAEIKRLSVAQQQVYIKADNKARQRRIRQAFLRWLFHR